MQLIRVTGMDGAKAYQMPPNSVVPLFDADNDIMYVKSTDGDGSRLSVLLLSNRSRTRLRRRNGM